MSQRVFRSCKEPIRVDPSFDERWRGPDKGLIICWEIGRMRGIESPELAERAKSGELLELGWRGSAYEKMLQKKKYGSLRYLAEWQGLRGEDLDIDLAEELEKICTKTGIRVIYTGDHKKYS